jgi:hypothetical protein
MPALAKIEIAATRDLTVWADVIMSGGLAARHATLKRRSGGAIATHSQQPVLRIVLN